MDILVIQLFDTIYILNLNGDNKWQKFHHTNCQIPYKIPISTLLSKFNLSVLKYVDNRVRNIVYGYFRDQTNGIMQIIPNQ